MLAQRKTTGIASRTSRRAAVCCAMQQPKPGHRTGEQLADAPVAARREVVLSSVSWLVLGSLLNIGAVPRPTGLGIQARREAWSMQLPASKPARPINQAASQAMSQQAKHTLLAGLTDTHLTDYGGGVKTLALCPSTPNCVSTAEEANDPQHYIPPWTYNPQDGPRGRQPVSQEQAMQELRGVVEKLSPDGFTPKVVKQDADFLYVEYSSPLLGFVDDVEFWFKPGPNYRVEYRSASRIGESDGDLLTTHHIHLTDRWIGAAGNINRKRIRAIRQELEKKGWSSVGF
ncbi:hypothetical protein QJQ45_016692 [Haematococcus lacustris]|nr:hypothetical protein QJQ45_016692 [Haematococcus lacustris]